MYKKLIYMKDACGNNLKVFTNELEASIYLNIDYFEFRKHLYGISLDYIPYKFEIKEVRYV